MKSINRKAQQQLVEIISNKKIGAYHHMVFAVGEMSLAAYPGNFVAIGVGGENSSLILRRAYAIYRAHNRGNFGGTLELVVAPHGKGSKWLASLPTHATVDMVGPLGTRFGIPTEPVNALLVGGGYGSAPLFGLADLLKAGGSRVDMVIGAATAGKIYAPLEGKRTVNSMTVITEDGSTGLRGLATDVIPRIIENNKVDVIYSCGPMAMLAAIQQIATKFEVIHQAAIEEAMACGIGVCMTCVIPLRDEVGVIRMTRSCIDGPVVDGSAVIWSADGIIPSGTLGEPRG